MAAENPLISMWNKNKRTAGFAEWRTDDDEVLLEVGRTMDLWLSHQDRNEASVKDEFVKTMQITIRNVELPDHLQRHGFLSAFIQHLFDTNPRVQAVCLEAVMNPSFKKYLDDSPRWICQTAPEYKKYNPNFAIFRQ